MSGMPGTPDTSQRDLGRPGAASPGRRWIVFGHPVWPLVILAVDVVVIHAVVVHGGELESPS